jgi:hypothetical protein
MESWDGSSCVMCAGTKMVTWAYGSNNPFLFFDFTPASTVDASGGKGAASTGDVRLRVGTSGGRRTTMAVGTSILLFAITMILSRCLAVIQPHERHCDLITGTERIPWVRDANDSRQARTTTGILAMHVAIKIIGGLWSSGSLLPVLGYCYESSVCTVESSTRNYGYDYSV